MMMLSYMRCDTLCDRVTPMEQQNALKHYTLEQKWETVTTERMKAKGGGNRRGSTGGIGEANGKRVSSRSVTPQVCGSFVVCTPSQHLCHSM